MKFVDIVIKNKNNLFFQKFMKSILFIALLVVTLVIWFKTHNTVSISLSKVKISQVKKGDLAVKINVYGKLVSKYIRVITTPVSATVAEILLKPGAFVNKNTIILKLSSPVIKQEVEEAQFALAHTHMTLEQLKIDLHNNELQQKSSLIELHSKLKIAQLKSTAESKLAMTGIVSNIQAETSRLKVQQFRARYNIEQKRFDFLKKANQRRLQIEQERYKLVASKLKSKQDRLKGLIIRANIDGVLQKLPIKLGQSLNAGSQLATVGSYKNLIAELKIPQSQASNVTIHNSVLLDTGTELVKANITRIEPTINDGFITVAARPLTPFNENARPELNIQAKITKKIVKHALYIEKPINVNAKETSSLFKLQPNTNTAKRVSLKFGEISDEKIQLIGGAHLHDTFIISPMKVSTTLTKIQLIQ